MQTQETVAVAGATGNAGRAIVQELVASGVRVRALARNPQKLASLADRLDIREVELTDPRSVRGSLDGVDLVISALGKTTQRGGAKRRLVDVDANLTLLEEARRTSVQRFGFISVATARADHPVAMVRMKGEVEEAIVASGVPYVIVQPTGYFSDLMQMFKMARRGSLWTFGDGRMRFNPVDPRDLAEFMVQKIFDDGSKNRSFGIGGPESLDSYDIARACEEVLGTKVRVRRVPLLLARAGVSLLRPFSEDAWQLGDFFVGNVEYASRHLKNDASMPSYGTRTLANYFRERSQVARASGLETALAS
ncbi:MAG: SDR family oxidoreductase [Planctomycetota bacterium]